MPKKDLETIKKEVLTEFSKRWDIPMPMMEYLEYLLDKHGNQYRTISEQLFRVSVTIHHDKIRYFKHKMDLDVRLKGQKPKNYRELLQRINKTKQ